MKNFTSKKFAKVMKSIKTPKKTQVQVIPILKPKSLEICFKNNVLKILIQKY